MELTNQDLEMLFEAVTAWDQEPVRTGMMNLVIKTAFIKDENEREEVTKCAIAQQERGKKARERKAILLKAKLVMAIEANTANALFANEEG